VAYGCAVLRASTPEVFSVVFPFHRRYLSGMWHCHLETGGSVRENVETGGSVRENAIVLILATQEESTLPNP
jgi:hypothetical protein